MTRMYIHLGETFIGTVTADSVRGRETWTFQYDEGYVNASVPFLDPAIANVTGPQFPQSKAGFGFLSDVAPDRWGRKLIRRREKRELKEIRSTGSRWQRKICPRCRAGIFQTLTLT